MAYIQRPIAPYPDPNPNGRGVLGADEDAEESYACTYRVSVGPMEVSSFRLKLKPKLGKFSYYHAHDLLNPFT